MNQKMGLVSLTFTEEYLAHSPVDLARPGRTKKMQAVLSGRGNDVEVLIRKIPTSQAYFISLFPLCFVLLRPCTVLYQSPWQSSLICGYLTLLHFYAHIIGLLDWTVDYKPSRETVSSRTSHY